MGVKVEAILEESRVQCIKESDRCGSSKGGQRGESRTAKNKGGAGASVCWDGDR